MGIASGYVTAREGRGHAVLIAARQHASDHRHSQCSTDLECHGVARRTDPGVSLRKRTYNRVRSRWQQQPGAQAN